MALHDDLFKGKHTFARHLVATSFFGVAAKGVLGKVMLADGNAWGHSGRSIVPVIPQLLKDQP